MKNKITLKVNTKPELEICKMNCDAGLDKKLERYELTKFLNKHSTTLFIGRPGSGKTSLVSSLFHKKGGPLNKIFHNVFLFQPSASGASMSDNIFETIPKEQQFNELNEENLQSVIDTIKSEDKNFNNCIIIDDMSAYLKNKDIKKLLKELIFNRRHLHCSVYFLVQTWFSIEKDIRKLFNNIFLFKASRTEQENIFEEVLDDTKKDLIPQINKIVYDKPYKYLFIDTDTQRLFSGFDEILIDEN
jgi:hypothetical protein|tara:strand:- start:63 stop:797 length:735 start_codon:yes stop_codon:yes gene_type:complete